MDTADLAEALSENVRDRRVSVHPETDICGDYGGGGIEPACRFQGDLQEFRDYGVLGPVADLASRLSTQAAAARPIDRSQTFIG